MVSHTHFNVTQSGHSRNYGNFGVTTFAHNSLKFNLLHIYIASAIYLSISLSTFLITMLAPTLIRAKL